MKMKMIEKKSVFYDCTSEKCCNKNPVRDMKKVSKCFVVSETFPIFAPAILEKTSSNALFDILHDRLTSFDLVKSGKFKRGVNSSLVKPVLYPDEGHGLSYYICDFGYFQNLTRQVCREDVSFSSEQI